MLTTNEKEKIQNGRDAVETYRTNHAALYNTAKNQQEIEEGHIVLLDILEADLRKEGYTGKDVQEVMEVFWGKSDELNTEDLGDWK